MKLGDNVRKKYTDYYRKKNKSIQAASIDVSDIVRPSNNLDTDFIDLPF